MPCRDRARSAARVVARGVVIAALLLPLLVPAASPAVAWTPADNVPPATISVCRGGGVEHVPFTDYVMHTLADEFPTDWPLETLKAGAVAVRSYAWWHVLHPYDPGRCHLTDGTRHQKYAPGSGNEPDERIIEAVHASWYIRLEEWRDGETTPAYAQYCNCSHFPEGEHLQQSQAAALGAQGWDHLAMLHHFYRNKAGLRIFDWRDGLGLAGLGEPPHPADSGLVLGVAVAGVEPGREGAAAHLLAECTMDGVHQQRVLQTVGIGSGEAGAESWFEGAGQLERCEETEVVATVQLTINGYLITSASIPVWKPWRSATQREITRIADTADPVAAAIAVSGELFADRDRRDADRRPARAVVLARSDKFADALTATGLAGVDAPILLNPGDGADLRADVADEITRILAPGGTVHLIGGPDALSADVERDPRLADYDVVRHAGTTRVETALAVADAVVRTGGDPSAALVARAYPDDTSGWADAVTGGAFAAGNRHPVLLTEPDELHPQTEAWIEQHGVAEAILLGGPAAVPADAEQRLGGAATRIAGATRDGTAVAVADQLWSRDGAPPVEGVLVIDAYQDGGWPFALVGAVYAANRGTPELVVTRLVPRATTGAWLDRHGDLPAVVIGDAVSERVLADIGGD